MLEQYLDQLTEALEASPVSAFEWKPLTRVLGVDMLNKLLGISRASIRRYARAVHTTPTMWRPFRTIADPFTGRRRWRRQNRLHWALALCV